ncbi:hypothetical protein C8A03DRAFT_33736 [Achaetomium macrosporum]|uniref:Uncharacterized protein n=1 Tax=Achaetomium macrosporum TaxID=79813 RepID=A0AAN7HE23_9PEZI|nr:hypothetical protein C8A03DRAFT_33736 [Achaetomium macrosporum]
MSALREELEQDYDYLNEFGAGGFTPDTSRKFRWPTHKDLTFIKPLLDHEDLHDAQSPEIDRLLKGVEEKFLRNTYGRLYDPRLDGSWEDAMYAWEHCHNGLWKARHSEYLEEVEVCHLAEKLVRLAQYDGDARLGPHEKGNWWILRDVYAIQTSGLQLTPELGEMKIGGEGEVELKARFNKAKFTVHLVHLGHHWAVMIYQPSARRTWFIDSLYTERNERKRDSQWASLKKRCHKARKAFDDWLARSKLPLPDPGKHYCASSPDQIDPWSCGLQVIANILAFIRYEAVGWHRIPHWAEKYEKSSRKAVNAMLKELVVSLHNLMGLRLGNKGLKPVEVEDDELHILEEDKGGRDDDNDLFADGMREEGSEDDAGGNGDREDRVDLLDYTGTGTETSPKTRPSDQPTKGEKAFSGATKAVLGRALAKEKRAQPNMAARLAELRGIARARSDAMAAALAAGTTYTPPEEAAATAHSGMEDDHDGGSAKWSTKSTTVGAATTDSKTNGAAGRGQGKTLLKRKAADGVSDGEEVEERKQQGRPPKRKKT